MTVPRDALPLDVFRDGASATGMTAMPPQRPFSARCHAVTAHTAGEKIGNETGAQLLEFGEFPQTERRNHRLKNAMFTAAFAATRHDSHAKAYYQRKR